MRKLLKYLIKFLKKIKSFSVLLFVLMLSLLIAAGWYLQWAIWKIIVAALAVIIVGAVVAIIRKLRSQKSSQSIEKSLKSQPGADAKQEEIEQLRQHLTSAIDALKNSKLGKGISGKSALYELPWYMFIGPPGAGKTTAIENSGLDFPYGTERIRGVGGTRNCDWFFSNEAIFLDTAGRYTTEEEDREEWFAFLDILKKNRRRQPINGVIIGISITDIINGSDEEIEQAAKTIRTRIDELTEHLNVRYPVYTVFTKCDLIRGFIEFFEDLKKTEREQLWGSTFTKDQREDPDVSRVFLSEFQKLHDSLLRYRIDRLSGPMNRQTRQRVYTFPVEFLQLKDQLDVFISKLFHPNPYKESPLFRGFYFTSGTQEGVPIDRVIQSIAEQFQLPQEDASRFDPEMEKKSYFIKDLFTKIMIPDQEMVTRTRKASNKYGALKIGVFSVAVILLGVFFIGASSSHFKFKSDSRRLLAAARDIEQIQWERNSFSDNFAQLNQLQQEIKQVGHSSIFTRGIYRGNAIVIPAKELFYSRLKPFIETYFYNDYLQTELERFSQRNSSIHRERAYNLLRVYLLLGDERERLFGSDTEKEFLRTQANVILDSLLQHRFNFAYQADHNEKLDEVRAMIHSQVDYFFQLFANPIQSEEPHQSFSAFDNDPTLIAKTRKTLGTPNISDVYAQIKREAAVETTPLKLSEIVGEKNVQYFASNAQISGFFTQEGFDQYVTDKIRHSSEAPGKKDWVLAISSSQLPAEMQDPKVMERDLYKIYYADYITAWRHFLKQIQLSGFNAMSSAAEELHTLANVDDSPLKRLLQTVSEQTQFESAIGRGARGIGQRIGIEGNVHPVDDAFSALHELTNEEKGGLTNLLGQYELVGSVLNTLAKEPDSECAKYAATLLQQRSGELIDAVRNIRRTLSGIDPQVQDALFTKPVILSWKLILAKTNTYLNTMWREQVYNSYKTALASHYPFNKSSSSDTPIADVVHFFNTSDGVIWKFVNSELKPFVRDNSYREMGWEGYGISLSSQVKNTLEKAGEISRGLNLQSAGNLTLPFSLLPKLPTPTGVVEQIILDVDGQTLVYRMGRPRWSEFNWPGMQSTPGAHLEIRTKQGSYEPLVSNSIWGWFHLLDQATVNRHSASNYTLEWNFSSSNGPSISVQFDLRTNSIYHPFGSSDFFDINVPSRLN